MNVIQNRNSPDFLWMDTLPVSPNHSSDLYTRSTPKLKQKYVLTK